MKSNIDRRMKKLLRDLKDSCARPALDRRRELTAMLERDLKSSDDRATARTTLTLYLIAHYYAVYGSMAVLDGDESGWADLERVLHYRWWRARISTPGVFVSSAACILAHALANDEGYKARWLAERMARSLDDLVFQTWEFSSFGAFLMKLWGTRTGQEIPIARPKVARLGVYASIFDGWTDEEQYSQAVSRMCDYHLAESRDSNDERQFQDAPYGIFPVDILALEAIRRRMGLSTPRPDHPLLATPLANPPPPDQRPRMGPDPLLEAVIKKARDTGFLPPEETGA